MALPRELIQLQAIEQLKNIQTALGYNTDIARVTRLDFNAFDPAQMPTAYVSLPIDRHNPELTPYAYEGRTAILRVEYAMKTQVPGNQLAELEAGIADVLRAMLSLDSQGRYLGGTACNLIPQDIDWYAADEQGMVIGAILDFEVWYRLTDPPDW